MDELATFVIQGEGSKDSKLIAGWEGSKTMKKIILAAALSAASVSAVAAAVPCPKGANDIIVNAAVPLGQMEFQSLVQTCKNGRKFKAMGVSFETMYRTVILPNTGSAGGVEGAYGAQPALTALLEGYAQ